MLTDDRISKPKMGYFFPLTVAEVVAETQYAFPVSGYFRQRIDLIFQNNDLSCKYGRHLLSFQPGIYLAFCSLPLELQHESTIKVTKRAIREFVAINQHPRPVISSRQILVYRAYLGSLSKLVITQVIIHAGCRPYLWYRQFAKLAKSGQVNEKLLLEVDYT